MSLKAELAGSYCLMFDVQAWDDFVVKLITVDGSEEWEETLFTKKHTEVSSRPVWQRFAVSFDVQHNSVIQITFDSYHRQDSTSYTAALDNVSIENVTCSDKGKKFS